MKQSLHRRSLLLSFIYLTIEVSYWFVSRFNVSLVAVERFLLPQLVLYALSLEFCEDSLLLRNQRLSFLNFIRDMGIQYSMLILMISVQVPVLKSAQYFLFLIRTSSIRRKVIKIFGAKLKNILVKFPYIYYFENKVVLLFYSGLVHFLLLVGSSSSFKFIDRIIYNNQRKTVQILHFAQYHSKEILSHNLISTNRHKGKYKFCHTVFFKSAVYCV